MWRLIDSPWNVNFVVYLPIRFPFSSYQMNITQLKPRLVWLFVIVIRTITKISNQVYLPYINLICNVSVEMLTTTIVYAIIDCMFQFISFIYIFYLYVLSSQLHTNIIIYITFHPFIHLMVEFLTFVKILQDFEM